MPRKDSQEEDVNECSRQVMVGMVRVFIVLYLYCIVFVFIIESTWVVQI